MKLIHSMQKNKIVGILYNKNEIESLEDIKIKFTKRAFLENCYNKPYLKIAKIAKGKNIKVCISSPKEFNNGKFDNCWMYENNLWIRTKNIKVDSIFNKFMGDINKYKNFDKTKTRITNPLELDHICCDKFLTYNLFPNLSPNTILIKKGKIDDDKIFKIKNKKVVLKPRDGNSGKEVFIGSFEDIKKIILNKEKDYLIQEFIDTSSGFKDIGVEGVHDYRITIINGEIVDSYVRKPTNGLISNTSLGAIITPIPKKIISQNVLNFIKYIDNKFKIFTPRVYSIDMMQSTDGRIYLTELNSKPGVDDLFPTQEKTFFNGIVDGVFSI